MHAQENFDDAFTAENFRRGKLETMSTFQLRKIPLGVFQSSSVTRFGLSSFYQHRTKRRDLDAVTKYVDSMWKVSTGIH